MKIVVGEARLHFIYITECYPQGTEMSLHGFLIDMTAECVYSKSAQRPQIQTKG
jgi:hypothetical protein